MHQLTQVRVVNFRSCNELSLSLTPVTPLVGRNNAGKSNILDAIGWMVSPFQLSKDDFWNVDSPVVVEAYVTGVDEHSLARVAENHRKRIANYVSDGTIRFRTICFVPGDEKKNIKIQIRNPKADSDHEHDSWHNPSGINNAISPLFPDVIPIRAMDDSAEDAGTYKTNTTIGKLLVEILRPVKERLGRELNDELQRIGTFLGFDGHDRPLEFHSADERISAIVREIFPELSVSLHIPPPTLEKVIREGTIRAIEDCRQHPVPVESLGHGSQRAIQIAMIRYLAETRYQTEYGVRRILTIEEPELYLHPAAIEATRQALYRLSDRGYQILYCTHSAHMIGPTDATRTVMVTKSSERGTKTRETVETVIKAQLDQNSAQLESLYSVNHSSQVLFADRVLCVEGDAESELIPLLYEAWSGKSLGEAHIAVVKMTSKNNIGNMLKLLQALGMPCAALADLDYAFTTAEAHGYLRESADHVAKAKEIFRKIASTNSIVLGPNDLPVNPKSNRGESGLAAEEAYRVLAANSDGGCIVTALHQHLLTHHVWIWQTGSFEHQLGIGKSRQDRATFEGRVRSNGIEISASDYDSIDSFFRWFDFQVR